MHSFKDTNGKEYVVRITFGTLRSVRDSCKLDLGKPFEGTPQNIQRLGDIETFVDVLYDVLGMPGPAEEFAAALVGDPFPQAEKAFWAAYEDFFRSTNRAATAEAIRKMVEVQSLSQAMLTEQAQQIDPATEVESIRQRIETLHSTRTKSDGVLQGSTATGTPTSTT